jgi:cyclophilin family peptidyl-prolyl cis-trans isomerase
LSSSKTEPTKIYAKLQTSLGLIEVELYPDKAPKTVANFVKLANSGHYNNLVWHRIVQGFVIQTGDPLTRNGGGNRAMWGTGNSDSTIPLEVSGGLHNDLGCLAMARSQSPDSASCQFYINLNNNSFLDQPGSQYAVFGKVIGGMDVVEAIGRAPVNSREQPINDVTLTSLVIQDQP